MPKFGNLFFVVSDTRFDSVFSGWMFAVQLQPFGRFLTIDLSRFRFLTKREVTFDCRLLMVLPLVVAHIGRFVACYLLNR